MSLCSSVAGHEGDLTIDESYGAKTHAGKPDTDAYDLAPSHHPVKARLTVLQPHRAELRNHREHCQPESAVSGTRKPPG